jgi:DNA sulfur modification protein DndD
MIFTELKLENFGAYRGTHLINLRPDNDEISRPIVLFGGMNGGGKTTLLDAIRLALYGQRAQCSTRNNLGYSDFLIQCINSKTPAHEPTRIELGFEVIIDGIWRKLTVVRHWTKYLKDGKDQLGVIDEDWPDSDLASTWDEYIENLLPLGISNLFLFDGEQVKELAEQDVPPFTVVNAIKSLLGLELADRLAADLDTLVYQKRKSLASQKDLETLEQLEAKIEDLQKERDTIKETVVELEKEYHLARKQLDEANYKFRLEGGRIAAQRSELEQRKNTLNNGINEQRKLLGDLIAGALPLMLIQPLLESANIQGKKELEIEEAKIALNVLKERDQRLIEHLNSLSLKATQLKQIKAFLEQENTTLHQEIDTAETPWLHLDAELLKELETILNNLLPLQFTQAQDYLTKINQLKIDLDNTLREIEAGASPEAYEKLDQELKSALKNSEKCHANYLNGERKLQEIEKSIMQIKKDLQEYSEKAIQQQNSQHIIQSVAKVQNTLKIFRERLTLKKLNKLEGEITECFRYLLHKSNLVHRVVIDTDNFSLSLYDPEGQFLPKHRLSAGEKQLLAIAFLWGLARVSGKQLPIAIDTPLGRLDSSHRNNLVERYFPTASHQVILLSTDTEIGEKELTLLRQQEAIAREYLLEYNPNLRQTTVKEGYFSF